MLLSDHCLCDDNECCPIQSKLIYIASVTIKLALSRNLGGWGGPGSLAGQRRRKKGDRGGGRMDRGEELMV